MSSQRVLVLELGVGVVDRVLVVLPADPGEVVGRRAVLLHVVAAGVAEHLRRRRRLLRVADLEHPHRVLVERVGAVGVLDAEAAGLHLLEAERQGAVDEAALDRLARQEQRRGAGRAVVVDVDDRDAGEAELVERPLAVGRVAVAVAGEGLLDVGRRGCRRRRAPSPPPPWPSRGSRPPWCRASRTWSCRHRSRTCGCSTVSPRSLPRLAEFGCVARNLARRGVGWGRRRPQDPELEVPPPLRVGPDDEGEEGDQEAEGGADQAQLVGLPGGLAEGVGEEDDVDRDRGREQRVLDGQQPEGEARSPR